VTETPKPSDRPSYQHPLSDRYASAEMLRVFSSDHRYRVWRTLWLALAEAQAELGLDISDLALTEMRRARDEPIDFGKAAEYERRFRHDVMAHVHVLGDAAPAAKGVIHLGATSAFVADNTDLVLHRDALRLVRARVIRSMSALAEFARRTKDIPTLGFTHFQPAQPTTVGKRATLWLQDLLLDLEDLEFRLETLRFRGVKGTTGTQASFLQLFGGDGSKVDALDRRVTEKLGFEHRFAVTGQTYPRKVDAQILQTLAGVGASTSKMGNDLRLLAHLREVEEPFESEQIGSSAMPYKRNPMRAERICALARHAITLSQDAVHTAASQWLERSLDDSANRRVSIPDAFLTIDATLVLVENVCSGLVVNEAVIRRRLWEELPFMAMEPVLMAATQSGGDRQDLHERIRVHAQEAGKKLKAGGDRNDLLDRIADDPEFSLDRPTLEGMLDPSRFVGRAPDQVTAFLDNDVDPLLATRIAEASELVAQGDVRV